MFKLWQISKLFYPEISYIIRKYRNNENIYKNLVRRGDINIIKFFLQSSGQLTNAKILDLLEKDYLRHYLHSYWVADKYNEIIKLAISRNDVDIIKFIINAVINDNDGEWNIIRVDKNLSTKYHRGNFTSPMIEAIIYNNMDVLELLVKATNNKNFVLAVNSLAAADNDNKLYMLEYLANLSTNKDYNFAITQAAENNRLNAIKILEPLNTGSKNYANTISRANKLGYTEVAKYLTDAMKSSANLINKLSIRLFKMTFY